ncbi:MAG: type II 3-dehydroquinate dehydratase [Lachnospiraceae bacterium]|nr:type II 3-dehydroquinate dehydratase [Lachnospiraceae bacterium]
MKLLVINGPNLNMLGIREPNIYGRETYADLLKYIGDICEQKGIEVEFFQSNHEGSIIDRIQEAYQKSDALLINPGGYTHTSVAIPDAIKAVAIPTVEVHLSDVSQREDFRKISYVSYVAAKTIYGKGFEGYREAIDFLEDLLNK